MADKPRNVPNAADVDRDETDKTNKMGHPERTVKQPGKPVKRVLNELDPEQVDIDAPIRLQELAIMARPNISEEVQDYKGVKGDFMTKMGDKTSRLGAKQKNTGSANEKCCDSSHGEASDGITTHVADLNLKTKQKNTGGTFETQNISAGTASDGITSEMGGMCSELGQNSKQKNKGGQFETFKGSKNTMSATTTEEWSLENIANIMEGTEINLQSLFDSYSGQSTYVCLEDFQQLCNAHGVQTVLSEQNLKALMAASQKFVFYEGNDAGGRFWQAHQITEMTGTGNMAVAEAPVEVEPEVPEVPEAPIEPVGEVEVGVGEVEVGEPDDLADVFAQIGDDFARAADMMAGHDESAETPEDEAAEGDLPFDGANQEGGGGGGEQAEEECSEEVCEGDVGLDTGEAVSADKGDMMGRIGSAVKGKATSVAMKGREEDEKNAVDPSKEVVKSESRQCNKCGTVLDESGCVYCDLMRETHEVGDMNGLDAKADSDGHYTTDKTKKGQGELGTKVPPQETCESTSGAASDGITTEVPGKQTPLKPKMKNTGGQAAFKGGSGTMKENVLRLSRAVKEAVTSGAKKIGRAGKYTVRFGVKAEGSAATFSTLTEALAVIEELLQVCDGKKIVFEALYQMPHQKPIIYRHRLPLAQIKRRDPIACEGKILFKTARVANAFADRVVSEGVACRVKNHNWGAAVTGQFSWPIAQKAFQTMSESWGMQIHTPEREAFSRGFDEEPGVELDEPDIGNRDIARMDSGDDAYDYHKDARDQIGDEEPDYGQESSSAEPGHLDPEGNICQTCGSTEMPDEHGRCYGCGEARSSGSPELGFGARPDENLAGSDDYLDFNQDNPPSTPAPRLAPRPRVPFRR